MKHRIVTLIWLSLLFSLTLSATTQAMTVKPMISEITPTGRSAQYTIHIDNPSASTLTVEMVTTRISMAKNGQETRTPADDDLLIIPVTAIIQPGAAQTVIIQYIGDPLIKQSQAYRVSIKQAAVDLTGTGKQAIGIGVNFNTLLNVAPPKSKAKLSVRSLKKAGKNWLLELHNSGDRYARISRTQWTITDKRGKKHTLAGKDIKKHLNGNLVLPNATRVFSMTPSNTFSLEGAKHIDIQVGSS
ncbi:MAG: hypothetical protein ACPG4U_00870 [Pseudomonadales bacterium]